MELAEQIEDVLYEHRTMQWSTCHCRCGWTPAMYLNDTEADRAQHRRHVALMVAQAITKEEQ